jgi:hypothetical protein
MRALVRSYFSGLGFVQTENRIGGASYKKGDIYVEVSYIPETAPYYSPSLILGINADQRDPSGPISGVPAWSLLPQDSESRKYSLWRFSDEAMLGNVLGKIKLVVIDQHLKPLWKDRQALEKVVENFSGSSN